jgi:hypothetical protein
VTWRSLPDSEDWLMHPVDAGMCRYESLKDGTLDLDDLARMNDYLAMKADNETLAQDLVEQRRGGK